MADADPVRLLYFAWLRERLGRDGEDLILPHKVRTIDALFTHLRSRATGADRDALGAPTLRAAVNGAFATGATPIAPGDEVAIFPPMTGG